MSQVQRVMIKDENFRRQGSLGIKYPSANRAAVVANVVHKF